MGIIVTGPNGDDWWEIPINFDPIHQVDWGSVYAGHNITPMTDVGALFQQWQTPITNTLNPILAVNGGQDAYLNAVTNQLSREYADAEAAGNLDQWAAGLGGGPFFGTDSLNGPNADASLLSEFIGNVSARAGVTGVVNALQQIGSITQDAATAFINNIPTNIGGALLDFLGLPNERGMLMSELGSLNATDFARFVTGMFGTFAPGSETPTIPTVDLGPVWAAINSLQNVIGEDFDPSAIWDAISTGSDNFQNLMDTMFGPGFGGGEGNSIWDELGGIFGDILDVFHSTEEWLGNVGSRSSATGGDATGGSATGGSIGDIINTLPDMNWEDLLGGLAGLIVPLVTDNKDTPPAVGTTNPASNALAQLFGMQTSPDSEIRGLQVLGPGTGQTIFGPNFGAQLAETLQGTTAPQEAAQGILAGNYDSPLGRALQSSMVSNQGLLDSARGSLNGLLSTGLPTDIQPLIDRADSTFRTQFLPDLFEKLPGGTLSSSGISNLATREAARMAAELGGFQFDAEEAAKGRMAQAIQQGLPAFQTSNLANASFPLSFANDLFNLDLAQRASSPGGQLLNAFTMLSGLGTNQTFTRGAVPSQSSQILDALAQLSADVTTAGG